MGPQVSIFTDQPTSLLELCFSQSYQRTATRMSGVELGADALQLAEKQLQSKLLQVQAELQNKRLDSHVTVLSL